MEGKSGGSTFATFKLPLDRLPDEVGTLLFVAQDGVDTGKRPLREPGRGLFVVDLFSSHI